MSNTFLNGLLIVLVIILGSYTFGFWSEFGRQAYLETRKKRGEQNEEE